MSVIVDRVNINPVDFSDSAIGYLDGCILDRYKAIINFHISKYSPPKAISINSATGIITNTNNLDFDDWSTYFSIGEQFKIATSSLNTGTLTITAITSTTITVTGLSSNETLTAAVLYLVSAITAMDFYYNLIGNNEQEGYISKTDANVSQKYTASGLSASSSTPITLNIGTSSMAWVTDVITGIASTSTIIGTGISGSGATYQQGFQITHYFSIAPFFLLPQLSNFSTKTPPPYFTGSNFSNGLMSANALQYIALFQAKYNSTDTVAEHTGHVLNNNGTSGWFNQNNARTAPDFTIASIAYADTLGNALTANDFSKDVNVTIKIKSAAGAFVNGTSKVIVKHIYCPLDPTSYQNTTTTLLQNFMYDQAVQTLGSAAVNGLNYGTNYQVIKNVVATYVDANDVTITFTLSYAAALKTILIGKGSNDRNYLLSIVCE